MTLARPFQRWRVAMSVLAAALMLMLVLGTPQGRGAAAAFLAQFRGERLAAVSLSTSQIANIEQTLSEFQHLGSISGFDTAPEPQAVASDAEASQFVGFPVLEPDPARLPAGISATPAEVRVMPAHQVRFTFDLGQARAYYQSLGRNDVTLPDRFDGVSLVVNTPPAVLLEYQSGDAPVDTPFGFGLMIGQAGTVTAGVEGGVTLEDLRVPLNRERVLAAAVRLADAHGVEALTMRRLGQELGVEAMLLYNHVANKDDILDGMVDIVFGEIDLPADGANWKATMRTSAISAHDVLLRHA